MAPGHRRLYLLPLLKIFDNILKLFDKKNVAIAPFVDLSKVFDFGS